MKRLFCTLMAVVLAVFCGVKAWSAESSGSAGPRSAESGSADTASDGTSNADGTDDTFATSAEAFILYCPDNGAELLSDNADKPLPMASTTKIMTSLLTLEYAGSDNKVVEFTDEMTAEGSSMYLKVGEKVTLDDLAVGMMMQSGNDAANAAAIAIAGSTESFAGLMNEKAAEIGMKNTHFVTPSGLDDDAHYSTARDMALLMAYALNNDRFAEITAQTSMTVSFTEPSDKRVTYPNHNKLLRLYDGCIGGKTGYTDKSGRCLVTAAKRGGLTLIAVTLNDRDDWDDHCALYDLGFENYRAIYPDDSFPEYLKLVGGTDDTVGLYAGLTSPLVVESSRADRINRKTYLPAFAYAPIKRGDTAGRIKYTIDGETIGEIPLLFASDEEYIDR